MTLALRRLVTAETAVLRPGETIIAAGRGRTVRGTDSAEMFPPNTIWALSSERLLVYAAGGRSGPQLIQPIVALDLGTVVTGARVDPFDDRDVLLVVYAAENPAMVLMDPEDAQAVVDGIDSTITVDVAPSEEPVAPQRPIAATLVASSVDPSAGDEQIAALRAALAAGDWEVARQVLSSAASPGLREWYVIHLTGDELHVGVDQWIAAEPESADAYLVRGVNAVFGAYSHLSQGGSDEAFWAELRAAERDLFWSIELDVADAVPFTPLVQSGLALGIPFEELCMRYDESAGRCPGLLVVHLEMLQALGPLGAGTNDEMFAFARTIARDAPEGSPLHALVPLAHLIATGAVAAEGVRRNYFSGEPSSEIAFFASMSVDHPAWKAVPGGVEAVNIFAAAFAKCGESTHARELLERNNAVRTARPWSLLVDGDELYESIVAAAVS